jgi:hypothetical protein
LDKLLGHANEDPLLPELVLVLVLVLVLAQATTSTPTA